MTLTAAARFHPAKTRWGLFFLFLSLLSAPCFAQSSAKSSAPENKPVQAPTVEEAKRFIAQAEARLLELWIKNNRASWVAENFITDDTEGISADADRETTAATMELARQARRFEHLRPPPDVTRKFKLLKLSVDIPAPRDSTGAAELAKIESELDAEYGKATWCPGDTIGHCKELPDIETIMSNSRDPSELLAAWQGWHAIGPPLRQRYTRMVDLANQGARQMGFANVGELWRSNYDMTPAEFSRELDRLWEQVRPLYLSLHAYVRWKLAERYGKDIVNEDGPIPAHLLGNMWAQEWEDIYPIVAPSDSETGPDLTAALRAENIDTVGMVRYAERFFTSLGFEPLPATFWERSLFTKPRDREVVCHASAESIDFKEDVRLKMCINISAEDFATVHHELGHNFYQRAYNQQPPLFQNSANDGFHEAIGDTIALSVTPEYLKRIGLIDRLPPPSADIGMLLQRSLDKIAFLPFGLMVDEWRWKVFSGEIQPDDYNTLWWALRRKYQGVAPPVARSEADFDPGAKYHIDANVPYARYFLATILQFQFHRALCKEAGYTGPLYRCSIYGNKQAGTKLAKMLKMGASRPWPDALQVLSGERRMNASALLEYFAPLQKWLDQQNAGHPVGWN